MLASRCLAMDSYSDFTIPVFSRHVIIYTLYIYTYTYIYI
jgi:hypothetical protein